MFKSVTRDEAIQIIILRKPVGLFFAVEKGKYIGIDNSTGDAWTEEFDTMPQCIEWLQGRELGDGKEMPNQGKQACFAARLSAAMFRKGYSPADLARAAEIPYNTVRAYIYGEASPTIEPLKRLCDALGVAADYLIGRREDGQGNA